MEAGTVFEAVIPGINTACRFSAAAATPLSPFTVTEAEYLSRDVAGLGIKNPLAESALRLKFSAAVAGNEIRLFLALSEADASLLLRLAAEDTVGVYVNNGKEYTALDGISFSIPLPGGDLYDTGAKPGVHGLRVLRNYLNYPDFFKFLSIHGLNTVNTTANNAANGGADVNTNTNSATAGSELLIVFKRREQSLAAVIKTSSVKVNCVPALNLFPRRSNRITLEGDAAANPYEFHLVPERSAMRDYEVVAVKNIDFYNERNELVAGASNFYDGDTSPERKNRIFFSSKRRRKLLERRTTARSSYEGTEVFVSFSPLPDEGTWQFAADLLVTNRDMPLLLPGGVALNSTSALAPRAVFLTLPTRPDYPLTDRGGQGDFSRLSHIVMNLSAMLCQEGARPLELLRNILRAYPLRPAEEMERMINGISALSGKSDTFRFIRNGAVFYEWGWRLTLVLDENAYAGMGFYIFAKVVAELLFSLTPLNTILEMECSTLQSGVIAVWRSNEE
jgi:type VI secretion system protein ImpG